MLLGCVPLWHVLPASWHSCLQYSSHHSWNTSPKKSLWLQMWARSWNNIQVEKPHPTPSSQPLTQPQHKALPDPPPSFTVHPTYSHQIKLQNTQMVQVLTRVFQHHQYPVFLPDPLLFAPTKSWTQNANQTKVPKNIQHHVQTDFLFYLHLFQPSSKTEADRLLRRCSTTSAGF